MTRLRASTTDDAIETVRPLHVAPPRSVIDLGAAQPVAAGPLHAPGIATGSGRMRDPPGGWHGPTPTCSRRRSST